MWAASMDQNKLSIPPDGGLECLQQLFRLSESSSLFPWDAIIVSIDIEASGGKRNTLKVNRKQVRSVREVGFAILDTRSLSTSTFEPQLAIPEQKKGKDTNIERHPAISTQQFSTSHASEDFEDCDVTDFQECVFAKTCYVAKEDLIDTITRCLQYSEHADNSGRAIGLRTIVIVGHSPQHDLEIIQRLGLQICRTAPIAAILDTYWLSKHILGLDSSASKQPPLEKYALSDILTELEIPHDSKDLHNAGNDATFTLHALIMLAIRWAETTDYEELVCRRLEQLRAFAVAEFEAPRWKPTRRALGAHVRPYEPATTPSYPSPNTESEKSTGSATLGSGLQALAGAWR